MKKKAQDLKPGEIIPSSSAYARRLILTVGKSAAVDDMVVIRYFSIPSETIDSIRIDPDCVIEVESPAQIATQKTLTPAQQHAEELLQLVRKMHHAAQYGIHDPMHISEANALLAKIDPPKPPSVEELVEALASLVGPNWFSINCDRVEGVRTLVERARAAGYLKQEAQ